MVGMMGGTAGSDKYAGLGELISIVANPDAAKQRLAELSEKEAHAERMVADARKHIQEATETAEKQRDEMLAHARAEIEQWRSQATTEAKRRSDELDAREKAVVDREAAVAARDENVSGREQSIAAREDAAARARAEAENARATAEQMKALFQSKHEALTAKLRELA